MHRALRFSTVELGHRITAAVNAGCPSSGGQRPVASSRGTAVVVGSLRRAALIGYTPPRSVVSTRQVGALGHRGARVLPRPAQPAAQADGFAAA